MIEIKYSNNSKLIKVFPNALSLDKKIEYLLSTNPQTLYFITFRLANKDRVIQTLSRISDNIHIVVIGNTKSTGLFKLCHALPKIEGYHNINMHAKLIGCDNGVFFMGSQNVGYSADNIELEIMLKDKGMLDYIIRKYVSMSERI